MEEQITRFEELLKQKRIESGLTQYKLGLYIGLKSNTGYKRLENNGNVSLKNLLKLSKYMDFDIVIKKGELIILD